MIENNLWLDVSRKEIKSLTVNQGDKDSRTWKIHFSNAGAPLDLSEITSISTFMNKPDRTVIFNPVPIDLTDNIATLIFDDQMCSAYGTGALQLCMYTKTPSEDLEILYTFAIKVIIEENAVSSEVVYSSSEFTKLNDLMIKAERTYKEIVQEAGAARDEAKDYSNISKSWAVGSTGVRSGEDTDNSKYYANQAASAYSQVQASAKAAADSASNAKTSEDNAKTYASNAKTSEDNAKTYASNAKTSETNASNSASSASTSASNAKTSETNAKTSEINAKTSEENAKTSEGNIKGAEETCSIYANMAVQSANNAAESEEKCEQFVITCKNAGITDVKIVEELPEIGTPKVLYLIMRENEDGSTDKTIYDEYLYVDNQWEHIGDSDVSNINYLKMVLVDTLPDDPEEQTVYFIESDTDQITEIDDTQSSPYTTYSSNKIQELIELGSGTLNKEYVDVLPDELDDDTLYFMASDNEHVTEINDSEIADNTTYSSKKIEERLVATGASEISDTTASATTTYSSNKIENLISGIDTGAKINDSSSSGTTTYSSNKIENLITGSTGVKINDTTASSTTTYSSTKINDLISNIKTGATINDSSSSTTTTYSSSKINTVASTAASNLINDKSSSASTVYSSKQVDTLIGTTLTGTLSSTSTSLTLSDESIKTDSMIDIYTTNWDVYPTAVTVSSGKIVMTFTAPGSSVTVKVVVK